jgi:hypothetical protein
MKKLEGFYFDLYIHGSEFFADLRKLHDEERKKRERIAKRLNRASRLLSRIKAVESFDIWERTSHIDRDFFGNNDTRNERVKQLFAKKARIHWVLVAMYNCIAFDYVPPGRKRSRYLRWSKCNLEYRANLEQHRENVLQRKWDAKRAKVRKRRESVESRKARNDALIAMGIDPNKDAKGKNTTSQKK